jgi:hypothetical protein
MSGLIPEIFMLAGAVASVNGLLFIFKPAAFTGAVMAIQD